MRACLRSRVMRVIFILLFPPPPPPSSNSGIIGIVDSDADTAIDWSSVHSIGFKEVVR